MTMSLRQFSPSSLLPYSSPSACPAGGRSCWGLPHFVMPRALAGSHQICACCWQPRRKQAVAGTKFATPPSPTPQPTCSNKLRGGSWYWVKEAQLFAIYKQVFGGQNISQQVEKNRACMIFCISFGLADSWVCPKVRPTCFV